jgi:hypothetical protein
MIEFFEFLNTCSPLRASAYLFFMFLIVFMVLSFITNTIKSFIKKSDDKYDSDWFKDNERLSDSE